MWKQCFKVLFLLFTTFIFSASSIVVCLASREEINRHSEKLMTPTLQLFPLHHFVFSRLSHSVGVYPILFWKRCALLAIWDAPWCRNGKVLALKGIPHVLRWIYWLGATLEANMHQFCTVPMWPRLLAQSFP